LWHLLAPQSIALQLLMMSQVHTDMLDSGISVVVAPSGDKETIEKLVNRTYLPQEAYQGFSMVVDVDGELAWWAGLLLVVGSAGVGGCRLSTIAGEMAIL
jgi:hypothetical protein